jgi:splicing factor 3A subunit 3
MEGLYQEFINIKQLKNGGYSFGGYLWYLQKFDQFHEIPLNLKEKGYNPYKKYLENLMGYLGDFFHRTHVLADFKLVERQISK